MKREYEHLQHEFSKMATHPEWTPFCTKLFKLLDRAYYKDVPYYNPNYGYEADTPPGAVVGAETRTYQVVGRGRQIDNYQFITDADLAAFRGAAMTAVGGGDGGVVPRPAEHQRAVNALNHYEQVQALINPPVANLNIATREEDMNLDIATRMREIYGDPPTF